MIKQLLLAFSFAFVSIQLSAQANPFEVVISGGTGYSFSNTALKTGTNLGLREAGLDSRVQTTWLVNGMIDMSILDNISVGIAYSHKEFYWTDAFEDTIQGQPVLASATIAIQKRNYAIRGLYHFETSENFEIYTGLRLGMTHWKIDINANAEALDRSPVSDFSLPATYPSIQVLGGFRHYFGRVFGWFGEIGVGTSPYFCSIGINIRPNPIK